MGHADTTGPFRFAHLSDLHLSDISAVRWHRLASKRLIGYLSWQRRRRHEHRPEMLAALRADLLQLAPDHVVITGDLTNIALPEEFVSGRHWLQALGHPDSITVVPGNHDRYVHMPWETSCGLWGDYMRSDHPVDGRTPDDMFPLLRIRNGVAFIGLDSAAPTPPFMATGRLGVLQLQRLEAILDALRDHDLLRVLLLHHPPVPGEEKWYKRLVDAPALCALLQRLPVDLVLHGHRHRALQSAIPVPDHAVRVFGVPSASAAGVLSHHPAAYNVFTVTRQADTVRVHAEARRHDPAEGVFVSQPLAAFDIPQGS